MIIKSFHEMEALVAGQPRQTLALAAAESEEALTALAHACGKGIVDAVLVGNIQEIERICRKSGIDMALFRTVDSGDTEESARQCVRLVQEGKAQLLMKGAIETGALLKVILAKDGLRTGDRLCSAVVLESARLNKMLVLADVGTNIAPSLEEKASILDSLLSIAKVLGIHRPKAAALCAVEKVNSAMPSTLDAQALAEMGAAGRFGDAVVEGPISMDIAINRHAAEEKGYKGLIKGDADILLVPNLESGNILIKGLMYLMPDLKLAGIGMGASVPLIISSRGDDRSVKYNSILTGSLVSVRGEKRR